MRTFCGQLLSLTLAIWLGFTGMFPTAIVVAADPLFDQGVGYEQGAYDRNAAQPTTFNWTRQSRFEGSSDHDEKWSFATGAGIASSPAIGADGTIYIGSYDGNVYALDPITGALIWTFPTGGWIASSPVIGADGTIYIGSSNGYLYALDPSAEDDDRMIWSFETDGPIASSPALDKDGIIYVTSYDGNIYALDPVAEDDDVRVKWTFELGGEVESSPAIGADEIIYVGSGIGLLYALDPKAKDDERVKWAFEPETAEDCEFFFDEPCPIYASPAIGADGTIYVGSDDGYVYALDPDAEDDDERVKWSYDTWSTIRSSAAIGTDGTVYIATIDRELYAFDPATEDDDERVKWSFIAGSFLLSSPIISADGTVYIASYDKKLYALDPDDEDKREKWSFTTGDRIRSSPAIGADGTIYVGSLDGKLYAIGMKDVEAPQWAADSELLITDITRTDVTLSWPAATDNIAVSGYRIYVDGHQEVDETPDEFEYSPAENIYTYRMTGLDPDTTYTFTVTAYDAVGNESDPGLIGVATTRRRTSSGGSPMSSNADLQSLEIRANGELIPLLPGFTPNEVTYTAETDAEHVELLAVAAHPNAIVMWEDTAVGTGLHLELKEDTNTFTLVVYAEDGTTKNYSLTIIRNSSDSSGSTTPSQSFTDIDGHWAERFIMEAARRGFVRGYPNSTFLPDQVITRAEFVVMLAGVITLENKGLEKVFIDYDQIEPWAQQAVNQLAQSGVIEGFADVTFRPNAPITRAEIAVIIARALQLQPEMDVVTSFDDDADIPQWAKGAVEALRKLGIVTGRSINQFAPNELTTRAEAVVILLRMLEARDH